nr:immunoglobulin light chain junction region [Macaca mulatta]
CQKYDNSPFTF